MLVVAACGGGGDQTRNISATGGPRDATSTANAVSLSGIWPLTGESLQGDAPAHPVYVVKVDNTPNSAPQLGLGSADLIVEELVEGGLTRLAVFFYSEIPRDVGPVRSMRASDIGIVKPAAGDLVASGGARRTVTRLASAGVSTFTEDASGIGFYRDNRRASPYNLFSHLSVLAAQPGSRWQVPGGTYLPFGSSSDFSGDISVRTITATFSGSHTTRWKHTADGWVRPDSFATSGNDFVADNVLLLRVRTVDAGYRDPAGNPVPETELFGTGAGVLAHGDQAMQITWTKKDKMSELSLTTKDGTAVSLPPGRTWIELVPSGSGSVALGK